MAIELERGKQTCESVGGGGGGVARCESMKVLERGSGASFLSRRTIYHPERSIGILNTTR